MTQKELDIILEKHKKWLNNEDSGERAVLDFETLDFLNLDRASLDRASLNGASLYRASLDGASLDGASLNGALLDGASLNRASLDGASLYRASLNGASLYRASLDGALLDGASLNRASLDGASLDGALLDGASLNRASLDGASLNGASLYRASLDGASLDGAKNIPYIPMVCPEEGAFYGYKKVSGYIVKLFIPKDAKRSSATSRKCRCSYAKVVSITLIDGSKTETKELVNTQYDPNVTYKVGEYVYPDKFDENRWNECSNGIHFFINRQEAVNY